MAKINNTSLFPVTTPADDDLVLGTDVSNTSNDPGGETVNFSVGELAGGMKLLEEFTASGSSSIDFTAFDNTKFAYYKFFVTNAVFSTSAVLHIRTSNDGGSTWDSGAGNYRFLLNNFASAGTTTTEDGSEDRLWASTTSARILASEISCYGSGISAHSTSFMGSATYEFGGVIRMTTFGGERSANETVNGVRFYPSTGTITSGLFQMYGIKG